MSSRRPAAKSLRVSLPGLLADTRVREADDSAEESTPKQQWLAPPKTPGSRTSPRGERRLSIAGGILSEDTTVMPLSPRAVKGVQWNAVSAASSLVRGMPLHFAFIGNEQDTGKFTRVRRVSAPDGPTSTSAETPRSLGKRELRTRQNDHVKTWLVARKKQLADREEREREVKGELLSRSVKD
jgi:hypothetical protein